MKTLAWLPLAAPIMGCTIIVELEIAARMGFNVEIMLAGQGLGVVLGLLSTLSRPVARIAQDMPSRWDPSVHDDSREQTLASLRRVWIKLPQQPNVFNHAALQTQVRSCKN